MVRKGGETMGLIKTINFEEKLDIIVTHILTGGGYLAIEQDTEFEKLVSMIREKQVPNILLDLTDDDGDKHYIKVKDVTLNDARDTIKMCTFTKDYYLEFSLMNDGSFNRVVKSAIGGTGSGGSSNDVITKDMYLTGYIEDIITEVSGRGELIEGYEIIGITYTYVVEQNDNDDNSLSNTDVFVVGTNIDSFNRPTVTLYCPNYESLPEGCYCSFNVGVLYKKL